MFDLMVSLLVIWWMGRLVCWVSNLFIKFLKLGERCWMIMNVIFEFLGMFWNIFLRVFKFLVEVLILIMKKLFFFELVLLSFFLIFVELESCCLFFFWFVFVFVIWFWFFWGYINFYDVCFFISCLFLFLVVLI